MVVGIESVAELAPGICLAWLVLSQLSYSHLHSGGESEGFLRFPECTIPHFLWGIVQSLYTSSSQFIAAQL